VEFSEWQLAVEIQRHKQVLARPLHAQGVRHAWRLPQVRGAEKQEIPHEEVPD
jgi:hypothetical protein